MRIQIEHQRQAYEREQRRKTAGKLAEQVRHRWQSAPPMMREKP